MRSNTANNGAVWNMVNGNVCTLASALQLDDCAGNTVHVELL